MTYLRSMESPRYAWFRIKRNSVANLCWTKKLPDYTALLTYL
jgi:hypothetical protein